MRDEVLHMISLDLHKAYDALNRSMCLDILEVYDVGSRALCLLFRYWEQLQMVTRAGGYCGEPLHREIGVTQGGPLFPVILNVVVKTVVCHWELLV